MLFPGYWKNGKNKLVLWKLLWQSVNVGVVGVRSTPTTHTSNKLNHDFQKWTTK
jgi:hypothetical protein